MLAVERLTRPLFSFDAGWLFIAAGVAICAAGVILPAQNDLFALQVQLEQLRSEESQAYARLKAYADFMDQVDRAEPALIRRLAATQLNVVPEGDTPVLLASSPNIPVTHWIEAGVQPDLRPPRTVPTSMLSRLANGPNRLWMFGAGIMSVFIGLMLAPISWRVIKRETASAVAAAALKESLRIDAAALEDAAQGDVAPSAVAGSEASHESVCAGGAEDGHVDDASVALAAADEILTEEKIESVLSGIESDLRELTEEIATAETAPLGAIEQDEQALDEAEFDDADEEPEYPEIATDAGHMFDSKNRMGESENLS